MGGHRSCALIPAAAPPPPVLNRIGVNGSDLSYSTTEQPFLNWVKTAGGNDNYWQQAWGTCTSLGGGGTHEQGYLDMDADGYVRSLTASPTPPGGQVFTMVQILVKFNINNPSGGAAGLPPDAPVTYGYAGMLVRVKVTGKGTMVFGTNFTSGSIVSVSGGSNVITSNSFQSTNNGVNIFTFVVTAPTNGIQVGITALPDNVNYLRDLSMIDNAQAAAFDAGAIFDPLYLAMMQNMNPIRFMTWLSTDNQVMQVKFPAAITASDTSAKMGSPSGKGFFVSGSATVSGVTGWINQDAAGDAQEVIAPGFVTSGTTGTFASGSGVLTFKTLVGGSAYTNGTYTNVPLTGGAGSGAQATVVVSGGAVTSVVISAPGTGYAVNNVLSASAASIGGTGSGFTDTVNSLGGVVTLSANALATSAAPQPFGFTMTWSGKTDTYNMIVGSYSSGTVYTTASQMISVTLTFGSKTCAFNTPISNSYPFTPGSGIEKFTSLVGGSGYTNGTYTNVALTGGAGSGAKATIIVSGGAVTSVSLTAPGLGYATGNVLSAAAASIGGTGSGFTDTVNGLVSGPGTVAFVPIYPDWAHRPVQSNCFWNSSNGSGGIGAGCPHEVVIALCNQLNVEPHICVPAWANTTAGTQAWWTSCATLYHNSLNSNLKTNVEFANEIWNGQYYHTQYSVLAGLPLYFPAQNTFSTGQEWQGTQVAQIADAFFGVYGGAYASRVVVGMGMQFALGNGDSFLRTAMNAPEWVLAGNVAPHLHPVGGGGLGAIYVAPYVGLNGISNANANTVLAQVDPPTVFFGLAYSNNPPGLVGGALASVDPAGFIGKTLSTITALIAANAGQAWGNLPYIAYESGTDMNTLSGTAGNTAWQSLIYQCHRDARYEYLQCDRSHVLSSNDGFFPMAVAAGMTYLIQFTGCLGMSVFGEYGMYENPNQPTTLASMPPKARGINKYALGL